MTTQSFLPRSKYLTVDTANDTHLFLLLNWIKDLFVVEDNEQKVTKSATGISSDTDSVIIPDLYSSQFQKPSFSCAMPADFVSQKLGFSC